MKHQTKQILRREARRQLFDETSRGKSGYKRPGSMNRHKSTSIKHLRSPRRVG